MDNERNPTGAFALPREKEPSHELSIAFKSDSAERFSVNVGASNMLDVATIPPFVRIDYRNTGHSFIYRRIEFETES